MQSEKCKMQKNPSTSQNQRGSSSRRLPDLRHQRSNPASAGSTNSQYANVQPLQGWYCVCFIYPRLRKLHRGSLIFIPSGEKNLIQMILTLMKLAKRNREDKG